MSTDSYIFVQYLFFPQDETFIDMDSWAASNLSADELIEYNAAKEYQNEIKPKQSLIEKGIIVAERGADATGKQFIKNYTNIDPPEGVVVRRAPLENNSSEETWVSEEDWYQNSIAIDPDHTWHVYFQRWLTETNQRMEKIVRDNFPL
jgi:hypothetical protein